MDLTPDLSPFDDISFETARQRLKGVTEVTPLVRFDSGDRRLDLRLKLENRQVTGAFKARGAWNNLQRLDDRQRAAGVVATSSGNHARALAWAARRCGVRATLVMPLDAYPNKIQACRDEGAEVVLAEDRAAAEILCAERVAAGATLVHPYDMEGTVEGAGTVGLELLEQWPDVELVVVPTGGGGLLSGVSLVLRRARGATVRVVGVEPEGAATLTVGLAAGEPVTLTELHTEVQGLCPPHAGALNVRICSRAVDSVFVVRDDAVFAAQTALLLAGETVEPAGAAALAWIRHPGIPSSWVVGRDARDPLRVACIVSGGNPDPAQVARLTGGL